MLKNICSLFKKLTATLTSLCYCMVGLAQPQIPPGEKPGQGEYQMTFPGVYFKPHSTEYAPMPYSKDSCFRYMALAFDENINDLVIWRDSMETESLTQQRVKKIKGDFKKFLKGKKLEIYSMNSGQKISRYAIEMASDSVQKNYLISLNSVLDIAKTRKPFVTKDSHILHPKIWCGNCWKNGFHLNKRGRDIRKIARRTKRKEKITGS